jgi:hypothetical protein
MRSGIVAQPPRPALAEVAAMTPEQRTAFEAQVLVPLRELATLSESVVVRARMLAGDDPLDRELLDGLEVAAARTRFAAELWAGQIAGAERALATGRAAVHRRHSILHDRDGERLLRAGENQTFYPYGYLFLADSLCYWERELVQARSAFQGTSGEVPPCFQL